MKLNINKISNFLNSLLIIFCLILNATDLSTFLIFFILLILFVINLYVNGHINKYKVPLLIVLSLCLPFSIFENFIFSQFVRFIELFILIYIFPSDFKPSSLFVKFMFVTVIYLVFIQFAMTLNIPLVTTFVDKFYPIEINYWGSNNYESIQDAFSQLNNRLAGIYYNPNLMGQSILLLYVIILVSLLKHNVNSSYLQLFLFILCLVSIVLSGSRTALITFIFINIFAYYKPLFRYILLLIPFFLYFFFFVITKYLDEVRVLSNITSPFGDKSDSGGQKLEVLLSHFRNYNYSSIKELLFLLFGKMNWDKQFDADPGYIISYFGLIGIFFLIIFISYLFLKIENRYKFVILIFMISIGGTIIINFRYSILAFYILSFSLKSSTQKKLLY
jgi:hypothetical protein